MQINDKFRIKVVFIIFAVPLNKCFELEAFVDIFVSRDYQDDSDMKVRKSDFINLILVLYQLNPK